MKKDPPAGKKWCAGCKDFLPEDEFLSMPRGWVAVLCVKCGRENMRRYKATNMVGRLPGEFTDAE